MEKPTYKGGAGVAGAVFTLVVCMTVILAIPALWILTRNVAELWAVVATLLMVPAFVLGLLVGLWRGHHD